jgi:hypothetical protein
MILATSAAGWGAPGQVSKATGGAYRGEKRGKRGTTKTTRNDYYGEGVVGYVRLNAPTIIFGLLQLSE